ncbi:MAG: dihydrodipicolinate synthase family protein [Deltaproteobacteria bacterium]|nr:dihydrodipicolinate synthase family protein [Deltaproteobacteria bacterium]
MKRKKGREALTESLFPDGIPRLWCPLLTHYKNDGSIDFDCMRAHFKHIVPGIKGYLIPGSTGDGWELTDEETMQVLDFAVRMVREHDAHLFVGVLKPDAEEMKRAIGQMLKALEKITGEGEVASSLAAAHVAGFTVCPPAGELLEQGTIEDELSQILEMGFPTVLYQLPQVTKSEIAPTTFETLAGKFSNLVFFKDSSGFDRIATSGAETGGVYLVRGAEGDYARWLKKTGGPYDGFLLSTANCFSVELLEIIEHIEEGDEKSAEGISRRITGVIEEMFSLVQPVPCGNIFTNSNKAIDHYRAYGPAASKKEGPMLHGGVRLSDDIIAATEGVLKRFDMMSERGYLE